MHASCMQLLLDEHLHAPPPAQHTHTPSTTARLTVKELQSLQSQFKDEIDYVVGDKVVDIGDSLTPAASGASAASSTGAKGSSSPCSPQHRALPEQVNAPWGLDSIDQSSLPLDGVYDYDNFGGSG